MDLKIAYGNSRYTKKWLNKVITFEELCDRLKTTRRTTETVSEYKRMSKDKREEAKDVGGFVLGHLREGKRTKKTVERRSGLTLDVDHADRYFKERVALECKHKCVIYSTHSHTPEEPRLRLILPTSREMTPEEYVAVSRLVAQKLGMDYFDDTTYEPERLMYWPSTPADGEYIYEVLDGEPLDPDVYLTKLSDWHDCSLLPTSSRQSEVVRHDAAKKQEDPLAKEGIVGTFCRAYTIEDAIETFLPNIYEPSAVTGRYDYIPADSAAGVVIYDSIFAYSHHATDPANGKLLNAFDLVRVHKFGDLEEKASYSEMAGFAVKDERVKELIAAEKRASAIADFSEENTEWKKSIEYEPRSKQPKNTLRNVMLILSNDPELKNIKYNQLSDSIEITGDVPWNHPSKFWRDADDAQLKAYLETNYGTFSAYNYEVALTKVADDRSFHPIRDFLKSLPEWDGVSRIDTIMADYFGATDNEYVRTVTRKMFCGAIARVMNPGCKFDYMLVMNGAQGLGKSTLLGKLGGDWFNDSLSLADTHDKTAAEKLQGYWLFEIPEMSGLAKADVNTLRGFLTRQNDIYRASYGRRAVPHPRQCVFFGSTNADRGYLRDTTGNRRFWPIKTPGNGKKDSTMTPREEILQMWAEAKMFYEAGEPLFLDKRLEAMAKVEQREAMEEDEREGMVRDYLDSLLPENWDALDVYERRAYLNGTDFGAPEQGGTIERTTVTNVEIWCECFGKDKANFDKRAANEVSAIMARIGGWHMSDERRRIPMYGQQRQYVTDAAQPVTKSAQTKNESRHLSLAKR